MLRLVSSVRLSYSKINSVGNCCKQWACGVHSLRKDLQISVCDIPNSMDMEALKGNKEYALVYDDIIKEIKQSDNCTILGEANQRLLDCLKYTVPYGRQSEGLGVIDSYRLIEAPSQLTKKNIKLAHVMSWCVAMLVGAATIQDDIMDGGETRNNQPCWHKLETIGLSAVNDSLLVQGTLFAVLEKYFSDHDCYLPTLELFNKSIYKGALGQAVDTMSTLGGRPQFEKFTSERIEYLAEYKTFVSCELPVRLALFLAGIYDPQVHKQTSRIASKVGLLLMVHNDVQDSFGKAEVVGRKGTDIGNGKCSWLAVQVLEQGTFSQKQLFMEHYGKPFTESVQIVQNLYKQLELSERYVHFEKETIKFISGEMERVRGYIPNQVFYNLLSDVSLYSKGYYRD